MIVRNGFEVLVERAFSLTGFLFRWKTLRTRTLSTLLYYARFPYRVAAGFASVETPVSHGAVGLAQKPAGGDPQAQVKA